VPAFLVLLSSRAVLNEAARLQSKASGRRAAPSPARCGFCCQRARLAV